MDELTKFRIWTEGIDGVSYEYRYLTAVEIIDRYAQQIEDKLYDGLITEERYEKLWWKICDWLRMAERQQQKAAS